MISANALSLCYSLLIVATSAQTYQPSVSNGTCYHDDHEQAVITYIPCGNDAYFDGTSCCQVGDICLSSNACFNALYGVTYLAGCTDPEYEHSSCPRKGKYHSQQWVGLVRCFVSNDSSSADEVWAPCLDKNQPVLSTADKCSCNLMVDTPAFTDSPTLTNIAQLPLTTGGTLSWFPGFERLSAGDGSTQSSDSMFSNIAINTQPDQTVTTVLVGSTKLTTTRNIKSPIASSYSNATSSSSTSSNNLSKGANIGIGVGVGSFVLAMIGLGGFCLWRKQKHSVPEIKDQIRPYSREGSFWTRRNEETLQVTENTPSYFGEKPELPADSSLKFSTTGITATTPASHKHDSSQPPVSSDHTIFSSSGEPLNRGGLLTHINARNTHDLLSEDAQDEGDHLHVARESYEPRKIVLPHTNISDIHELPA